MAIKTQDIRRKQVEVIAEPRLLLKATDGSTTLSANVMGTAAANYNQSFASSFNDVPAVNAFTSNLAHINPLLTGTGVGVTGMGGSLMASFGTTHYTGNLPGIDAIKIADAIGAADTNRTQDTSKSIAAISNQGFSTIFGPSLGSNFGSGLSSSPSSSPSSSLGPSLGSIFGSNTSSSQSSIKSQNSAPQVSNAGARIVFSQGHFIFGQIPEEPPPTDLR